MVHAVRVSMELIFIMWAGLRALLRFLTGVSICLNRGDVDPKAQKVFSILYFIHKILCCEPVMGNLNLFLSLSEFWQRSTETAGRSLVSIVVDHIFLCIKDAGLCFFLENGFKLFI